MLLIREHLAILIDVYVSCIFLTQSDSPDAAFRLHSLHLHRHYHTIFFIPLQSESGGEASLWFPELASLDLSENTNLISLGPAVCRLEKLSSLELDGCTSLSEVCCIAIELL